MLCDTEQSVGNARVSSFYHGYSSPHELITSPARHNASLLMLDIPRQNAQQGSSFQTVASTLCATHHSKQLLDPRCNRLRIRIIQKVPSINNTHIRVRQISLERLGSWRDEEGITLAPDRHEFGLMFSEVSLPLRIGFDVGLVVLQQMVELDLERAFARHVVDVEVGAVGGYARSGLDSKFICAGETFGGENVLEGVSVCWGGIGPECTDTAKGWGQTLVVRAARLREDTGDAFGVF